MSTSQRRLTSPPHLTPPHPHGSLHRRTLVPSGLFIYIYTIHIALFILTLWPGRWSQLKVLSPVYGTKHWSTQHTHTHSMGIELQQWRLNDYCLTHDLKIWKWYGWTQPAGWFFNKHGDIDVNASAISQWDDWTENNWAQHQTGENVNKAGMSTNHIWWGLKEKNWFSCLFLADKDIKHRIYLWRWDGCVLFKYGICTH